MSSLDICFKGIAELAGLIYSKELSPVELTRACLNRIEAHNSRLNAFINVFADEALKQAERAEKEIGRGLYKGPLHGIPYGLKDLFMVADKPMTLGSRSHHENIAPHQSTVALRLERAGAVLLGKQNMNPLAYGPFAPVPGYDYGATLNPWDTSRITGGSSGGSGSATAAGFCPFSMGSDTGGSIRIPAAWCGTPALKPTYGRISRYGIQALAWSLDHPGPFTRRVKDLALVMQAVSGFDPLDQASSTAPVPDFSAGIDLDARGLRIGLPVEYQDLPLEPEVREATDRAIQVLRDSGAETEDVSWPMLAYAENISNIILLCEASSAYETLVRERGNELWPSLRLRLEAGLLLPASDYLRAQKARTRLIEDAHRLFTRVDLIAGPTMPITAVHPGEAMVRAGENEIGVVRAMTQYNEVLNLTGHPALTIPCGFSRSGLPMGLQLAGRPFEEPLLLRAGQALENALGLEDKTPVLS